MKDGDGHVIGFEKLNFSVPDSDSLRVALETAPERSKRSGIPSARTCKPEFDDAHRHLPPLPAPNG